MSQRGLAWLSGINESTLRGLLRYIEAVRDKVGKNPLKSLPCKVFSCAVVGVNGAKIINAKAAARIIRY